MSGALVKFKSIERAREREREMKNEEKSRPVRKALRDVSNNHGGGRSSRFSATAKKKDKELQRPTVEQEEQKEEDRNDDALDRLLLVQSDLSALVNQVPLSFSLYFGNFSRNR